MAQSNGDLFDSDPLFAPSNSSVSLTQSSQPLDIDFRRLVVSLARELNDEETKDNIRFLMNLGRAKPNDRLTALQLFQKLLDKGEFSASNTKPLEELLESCHRCDLIENQLKPYEARNKITKKRCSPTIDDLDASNSGPWPTPLKKPKVVKVEEFDVSNIKEECINASVHGVIVRVSSIREAKQNPAMKYFTAEVSDGIETLKFFCSDCPTFCSRMRSLKEKKIAITIKNCTIKQSVYPASRGFFELYSTSCTKIFENPSKKFEIEDDAVYTYSTKLNNVADMKDTIKRQIVTVRGKIISVEEPADVTRKTGKEFKMQKCILSDTSMAVKLNIWENQIGTVRQGSSYVFINVKVKEYNGEKHLSTFAESEIQPTDDIVGEVSTKLMESSYREIQAVVSGVNSVLSYKKCTSSTCSAKVDCVSGTCTKCNNKVRLELCEEAICVKFTIQSRDGDKTSYDVTAFDSVVYQITGSDAISDQSESDIKDTILRAAPAVFVVNLINDIVVEVKREVSTA